MDRTTVSLITALLGGVAGWSFGALTAPRKGSTTPTIGATVGALAGAVAGYYVQPVIAGGSGGGASASGGAAPGQPTVSPICFDHCREVAGGAEGELSCVGKDGRTYRIWGVPKASIEPGRVET